ncbi:MAG: response regulator [Burkholderiales bacterium]
MSLPDHALRRFLDRATAVVVDSHANARSLLITELKQLGVANVISCRGIADARARLAANRVDIVLCEYHFDGTAQTGQDLLDEIREQRLLPLASIFFMVTGEAKYEKVVEVVETAPDDYLLKPFTVESLGNRLEQAMARKLALAPIYQAIDAGEDEKALAAAETAFRIASPYQLTAAKLAGELCIKLGRMDEARAYYDAVLKSASIPWARLGIARIAYAGDDSKEARHTLETLVSAYPTYVDAYDLLGRMMIEGGELDAALRVFQQALAITPASVTRLQRAGSLAFMLGRNADAEAALGRAVRLGTNSRALDFQTVLHLAIVRLDADRPRDIAPLEKSLAAAREGAPDSYRLRRLHDLVRCVSQLAHRKVAAAIATLEDVAADVLAEEFDLELACDFLAVLRRLRDRDCQLADEEDWVERVGSRFCTSKAATSFLASSAGPELAPALEEASALVSRQCNDSLLEVLQDRPLEGVRSLLEQASRSRNARQLALVESIGQKRRSSSPEMAELVEQARALRERFCTRGTHAALALDGGLRQEADAPATGVPVAE